MRNQIAAIVVTYNRRELLSECLDALFDQTYKDFDIIVIDNASSDGTKDSLKQYIDHNMINYYNTGENIGGAGGFNFGIKKAYELGYSFFWLMDDDTIPKETALYELYNSYKKTANIGYLCSRAIWVDGSPCIMNQPRFIRNSTINQVNEEIIPVCECTFVSFFTTRDIVKKVGLPIKEFFIWADDTNYCLRINRYAKGYLVPNSIVIHKMKINERNNLIIAPTEKLERYYYRYRNRYYNSRMERKLIKYYLSIIKTMIRICLFAKDNRLRRFNCLISGVLAGMSFHPEIEMVESEK